MYGRAGLRLVSCRFVCGRRNFSESGNQKLSLAGKKALVTGSTSGIGLDIAFKLAGAGCSVALNGFGTEEQIKSLCHKIQKDNPGINAVYCAANLMYLKEIEHMMTDAKQKLGGKLDILVNNAGIQYVCPIVDFPPQKFDDIIAVNLAAVFHTTRLFLKDTFQPDKKSWGRIINISSVHGLVGSAHKSAYVASKHGVVGLTKVTALEMAGKGITCNCINPGWVLTALVEKQIVDRAVQQKITPQQASDELLAEKQPSKEFVNVDEISQTTLFLCSDAASHITGICIPIDGGWTSQ